MPGLVEIKALEKHYGQTTAVADVSLTIEPSEFVTLLGASGSGKTTTLMMVAGFESPSTGDIFIDGKLITHSRPHQRGLGVVFQHYALFPHMTIFDNLAFPLRVRSMRRKDIVRHVGRALELVHLSGYESRYPSQLSGGQQQRIAVARALIYDPPVLLMDEPLGALDRKLRAQLQLEIKRIQRDLGITILYVTHDQEEALTMSDRIGIMRNGKLIQIGTPTEIYDEPADEFVAEFIGDMNFLPVDIALPLSAEPREGSIAAIRPERISLALPPAAPGIREGWHWSDGVVEDVIYCGEATRYRVKVGDLLVESKLQAGAAPHVRQGNRVSVGWADDDVRIVRRT